MPVKNALNQLAPAVRRAAAFRLWMANLVMAVLLGVNYLVHMPEVDSGKLWFFALPALVSSALMVTLVPGSIFTYLAGVVRSVRTFGIVQAVFWTILLILLFTDTRIYNMFRYHLNGQVLNLVYVRGSEDAIHLGWQVWTAIGLGLAGVGSLQIWLWGWALRGAHKHDQLRIAGHRLLKPSIAWGMVLVSAVLIEKSIYAEADLTRDRQLTNLARIFPLYARVPLEKVASSVLGVQVAHAPRVELDGFSLDYPHARPAIDPEGPRPNVLIVLIDCLRRDRLDPLYTPNVSRWAEDSLVFEDHLSAGNSTRFGIFSLLYGLHGSYWFPVLEERRGPVLVDTLVELGYEFGIFGSASMGYPELRDTAWSAIPDRVFDDFGAAEPWRRDEQAAEAMIAWLDGLADGENPFFGLVLLDSPHQTYSHPPDVTPFTPSAPEIDYLSLTRNEGPEPKLLEAVRNRYDNAVYHADDVAGRVLDAIAASPRFENTIVVVTGDHGEEFLECGFFGHTSAYTLPQVAVPFVLRGPGIEPGVETGPTSHLDFPSTLLEMLGANPAGRDAWCLGSNLFDPPPDRRRVLGGWNELGVWTPEGILRVPLSLFEFDVEVYDYEWNLIVDDRAALTAEAETLERLGAECNRFLR